MGDTYHQLAYHVIFSTKNREPTIADAWVQRLYAYMGALVRERDGRLLEAGGVADHVHLLLTSAPKLAPAELVRDIKAISSGWLHQTVPGLERFAWQTGYGIFSVSTSIIGDVRAYIQKQAEHHERYSFQDEFRVFLAKHGIEWDERYVWG